MGNSVKTYPYFSDGEVLTAEMLNDAVAYLAGQPKVICKTKVGYGIIKGLQTYYNDGCLTIMPGCAIFHDGTVLEITSSVRYPFLYKDKGILYFSETEEQALDKLNLSSINEYEVVLELVEKKSSTVCNQISCDLNHTEKYQVLRPRLLSTGQVNPFWRNLSPLKTAIDFIPLHSLYSNMNYAALMKLISGNFNTNRDTLCRKMLEIVTKIGEDIYQYNNDKGTYDFISQGKGPFWMDDVIPDWRALSNRYVNAISKIHKLNNRGKGTVVVPYYFLEFLQDMRAAVLEFSNFYDEFCHRYKTAFKPFTLGEKSLVLTDRTNKGCITVFCPAVKDPDRENASAVLNRMLERICKMAETFIGFKIDRSFSRSNVQIVPFVWGRLLQEKPVPFYYKGNTGQYWKIDDKNLPACNYEYDTLVSSLRKDKTDRNPLLGNPTGRNFRYCVQGVYDMKANKAKEAIEEMISYYELPLTVRSVELRNIQMNNKAHKAAKGTLNYYDTVKSWLNSTKQADLKKFDIEDVPDPYACKHRVAKHKKERAGTMKTREALLSLACDSNMKTIIDAADSNERLSGRSTEQIVKLVNSVSPHQFKIFLKYFSDIKQRNMYYHSKSHFSFTTVRELTWADRKILSFSKFKDYLRFSFKPEYKYCNLDGAADFGEIVLFHYDDKIVLTLYSDKK